MLVQWYLASIILANVVTAATQPLQVGYFLIPYGTFLIGCTFVLRDFVQREYGRIKTYFVIILALLLSAVTSYLLGDTLFIVLASSMTFLLSEAIDTEVFTRLRCSFPYKILISGVASGIVDSIVFAVIGLSPLGAGILPWKLIPHAILGQFTVKVAVSLLAARFYVLLWRGKSTDDHC